MITATHWNTITAPPTTIRRNTQQQPHNDSHMHTTVQTPSQPHNHCDSSHTATQRRPRQHSHHTLTISDTHGDSRK